MNLEVNKAYKVRKGYTLSVGCNVFESEKVIEATDGNIAELEKQKFKLEPQSSYKKGKEAKVPNKMMKTGKTK